jgi:hypothetical protein
MARKRKGNKKKVDEYLETKANLSDLGNNSEDEFREQSEKVLLDSPKCIFFI